MSQILDATLVIAALRMALSHRRPAQTLILHGAQFASAAYRQVLAQHGLVPSMSRKANCYDNAFIESFFSSLKYELVYHHRFATRGRAAPASSITSRPSTIAPDFTPVLTTRALSTLNPN
jgi:transposase InsO family protein